MPRLEAMIAKLGLKAEGCGEIDRIADLSAPHSLYHAVGARSLWAADRRSSGMRRFALRRPPSPRFPVSWQGLFHHHMFARLQRTDGKICMHRIGQRDVDGIDPVMLCTRAS